jgi:hypothetical protein
LHFHGKNDLNSKIQSNEFGAELIKKTGGSVIKMLRYYYPNYKWQEGRMRENPLNRLPLAISKSQIFVVRTLRRWFPENIEIECNEFLFKYAETQKGMQLDVWVPTHNLAIEYQGSQHYNDNPFFQASYSILTTTFLYFLRESMV